jgi:hypothetical protein
MELIARSKKKFDKENFVGTLMVFIPLWASLFSA